MKPHCPLFPFEVCWSYVSNLARILGHSSLKFRNRQMDDHLWKFLQHPSKSLAKLMNYLRAGSRFHQLRATVWLFKCGHLFEDSFSNFRVSSFVQNFNLAIQTRTRTSWRRLDIFQPVENIALESWSSLKPVGRWTERPSPIEQGYILLIFYRQYAITWNWSWTKRVLWGYSSKYSTEQVYNTRRTF